MTKTYAQEKLENLTKTWIKELQAENFGEIVKCEEIGTICYELQEDNAIDMTDYERKEVVKSIKTWQRGFLAGYRKRLNELQKYLRTA